MINILACVGMSLQSEVCLWTLLGLLRRVFDATLFRVNSNLKQVWQMRMPVELTVPVQRMLRTMISGVMLVQCFTVYIYLASYIVLLYPVFLEERPALVLPWLLLAAIRKLLCELTNIALGLGTCVMLGPARPPCIKFVITKTISIMPAFYMWMLVYSYYLVLKVTSAFKTFPTVLLNSNDDILELAIRRRRTKSLLGEDQLRRKIVTNFYNDRQFSNADKNLSNFTSHTDESIKNECSNEEINDPCDILQPRSNIFNLSNIGYEDLFVSEITIPRDGDRVLEQFGIMMLRIAAFMMKEGNYNSSCPFNTESFTSIPQTNNIDCTNMPVDDTETPLIVGSTSKRTASYLEEYPKIFMKNHAEKPLTIAEHTSISCTKCPHGQIKKNENCNKGKNHKQILNTDVGKITTLDYEKDLNRNKKKKSKTTSVLTNSNRIQDILNERSTNYKDKEHNIKLSNISSENLNSSWEIKQEIPKQFLEDNQLTSVNTVNTEMPVDLHSLTDKPENSVTSSRYTTETFRNELSRTSFQSQNTSIGQSTSTEKISN